MSAINYHLHYHKSSSFFLWPDKPASTQSNWSISDIGIAKQNVLQLFFDIHRASPYLTNHQIFNRLFANLYPFKSDPLTSSGGERRRRSQSQTTAPSAA